MRSWILGSVALLLCACGGSSPPPAAPKAVQPKQAAAAPVPAPAPMPTNALRRSSVRAVLAQGPGAFLQRISVDDQPVFVAGKFHGFRITALNGPAWWRGVDLKPGDVVTQVNGFPIEHPEDALEAFKSLAVASELRVSYERDGVARELRYAIVDDASASPRD